MRTKTKIKKAVASLTLSVLTLSLLPLNLEQARASSKLVYPLKKISKLECRFNEFNTLGNECIEDLPILRTSDYKRYASENGGYNKFTRLYTVLWGASYKYGWDIGYGGHMGIDIATARGTPVYSMADGEVIQAGTRSMEGKFISIRHNINGKTIVSNYLHLNDINVSKGERVRAGEQIGTVGSTGNSTGNHLHFQIDTLTTFSPIYYNRGTCPYGYFDIVESGKCFDELEKITVDPLLFLETNGGILNSIQTINKVTPNKIYKNKTTSNNKVNISNNSGSSSIFDRNVFIGSSYGDVREVQSIYKALGYYKGEINGDYNDVLESVIKYQIDKKIISKRGDAGTGNFGPMTRAQTKKDYNSYIKSGGKIATTYIASKSEKDNNKNQDTDDFTISDDNRVSVKTEKISRQNMMTREQLEAKEVNDFLKDYKIDLSFENTGGSVALGDTETINLSITNHRGKYFKGTMPGEMTFVLDKGNISVFPEKLFYFTDGKREIKVTGLKEGTTKLHVKVGKVNIKTFTISVFNGKKSITPDNAIIIGETSYLGNGHSGIALLKDNGKNLINIKYSGKYKLKASEGNLVCLKSGKIENIQRIHTSGCNTGIFKNEIEFSYNDTVSGLVLFEYKALNKNAKFEILSSNGRKLGEKKVAVLEPKGLNKEYAYSNEVLESIEKGIATTGLKRGYFMQDNSMNQKEAISWIKNALNRIETKSNSLKKEINSRIIEISSLERISSDSKIIDRAEMLKLADRYLVFGKSNIISNSSINYKDLNKEQNEIANMIFNKNNTWKEQTGKEYFKPKSQITRGETAYLIINTLKNGNKNNISLR